jgi:uncharacterized protein YqjF (DUF2071 family)
MHTALRHTEHRPWPVPSGAWVWRQSWCDLLFAHWPVPASVLRPHVPSSLELDQHAGTAWLAVVPFRMQGVMRRSLPDLPWISAFPELNVRTYVTHEGKPGVWFFSLDATNWLAIWAARRFFHLPYRRAVMQTQPDADGFRFESKRVIGAETFVARYAPTGPVYRAERGSLEHFLTERYCLYAQAPDGALFRTEVNHEPWPLQLAAADITANTMTSAFAALRTPPALLHFAEHVDVVAWSPVRVG